MDNFNISRNGVTLTSNQINDIVQKTMNINYKDSKEKVHFLGMQNNVLLNDLYPETWGMNRGPKENIVDYFYRVYGSTIMRDSYCLGMEECLNSYMHKMNANLSTFPHTYYFSMAAGERKLIRTKQRDVFSQP